MMWSKKVNKEKSNIFIKSFSGKEVEVFTGMMQNMSESNGEGAVSQEIPLVIRGYILDVDEEFIYLGDTLEGISKAVKFGPGTIVEIIREKVEDVFDGMPYNGRSN